MSMIDPNCGCSEEQVDLMFKESEQYIDDQIADRTYQMARYWIDLYPVKPFPDGVGLSLDKVQFFGDIGPQYDGFDGWRKVQITRRVEEAAVCGDNDGCAHVWEEVGHGMQTISYDLMQRDLRTKKICVKDIRTFWQYQQFQNLIFKNLANISANMREQLNRNAAQRFSVKHIALPNLPTSKLDPHQFPVIPSGVEVGRLTYRLLILLYHFIAQEAAQYALTNIDGMPAFGLVGTPETLYDMYYDDPELRKDMRRCSGMACDLINRYNFLDSIGPFLLMPDLYAPRFNRDANGVLQRVFPHDRNFPVEIGTRAITNPEYHTAEFEYVMVLTRDLFAIRTRRALSSVGGQTDFDAEVGLFEWIWHNPPREDSPYRRTGRYVTTAELGIEPGDFTDIPGILVRRRPGYIGIQFWGVEACPPEPSVCENALPDEDCPCPQVIGMTLAVNPLDLIFTFDRDTGAGASDTMELRTVNGSFASGTVEEVSTDGTIARVRFAVAPCAEPGHYVEIRCSDVSYCSANVLKTELCNILSDKVTLFLNRLIKADTAADVVTLIMGDGSTIDAPLVAPLDIPNLKYSVTLTFAQYCDAKGICAVCVPPATDETCPDCDAAGLVDCVPPEES